MGTLTLPMLPLIEPCVQFSRTRLSCRLSSEANQSLFFKVRIVALVFRLVVSSLTPSVEVGYHSLPRVVTDITERLSWVSVVEVATPTSQVTIDVLYYLGRWFKAFLVVRLLMDDFTCLL